jgi:ankyrin repeat protein
MEKFINFRGMGNIKTESLYFTPLHEAVEKEDIETLHKYLKNGASPDIRTRGLGYTPLYKAVEAGNLEMVKILFQFNANKEIVSKSGNNPYDIAIKKGHHKIAKMLDNYQNE